MMISSFIDDVAGKITLKHLYEIAKIKSEDRSLALLDLQQVTQMLVGIAKTCGIEIVREIDPEEYAQFIKDRKVRLDEYDEELKEIREKKALKGNVV
jgi:large subunit ribosomal protein L11